MREPLEKQLGILRKGFALAVADELDSIHKLHAPKGEMRESRELTRGELEAYDLLDYAVRDMEGAQRSRAGTAKRKMAVRGVIRSKGGRWGAAGCFRQRGQRALA